MKSPKPNPIKFTLENIEALSLLVQETEPGKYTLRQIHGEQAWQHERRPQAFGIAFKAALVAGKIRGIRCVEKQSNKSQLYEVLTLQTAAVWMRVLGALSSATSVPRGSTSYNCDLLDCF